MSMQKFETIDPKLARRCRPISGRKDDVDHRGTSHHGDGPFSARRSVQHSDAQDRSLKPISARLRELDGGDRPLPMVASDRDSQAVHFVKPNTLHRTGLSVGEDHGLADKLSLGLLELAKDRGRTELYSWHW